MPSILSSLEIAESTSMSMIFLGATANVIQRTERSCPMGCTQRHHQFATHQCTVTRRATQNGSFYFRPFSNCHRPSTRNVDQPKNPPSGRTSYEPLPSYRDHHYTAENRMLDCKSSQTLRGSLSCMTFRPVWYKSLTRIDISRT